MFKNLSLAVLATLTMASVGAAQRVAAVTEYGPSCGLTATGSVTPNGNSRRVSLECSGAPPRVFVLFMVSGAPGDRPLIEYGSNCHLLLDTVPFSQVHTTKRDGTYTFSKALGQIYPIETYVQFMTVEFDRTDFIIRTSNGLFVSYV